MHHVHTRDPDSGLLKYMYLHGGVGRCSSFCEDDDFTSVRW